MAKLCVNIDHIATLREARKGVEPDPLWGAVICELAGVNGITVHLREDRRHIRERDVRLLKELLTVKLNLEMSVAPEIVGIAQRLKPEQVTLVPEKREELTTEGGLDVLGVKDLKKIVDTFKKDNIIVSLFIDAEANQIKASGEAGADFIELHTGQYANVVGEGERKKELEKLADGAKQALDIGLRVHAGHGLNYQNVKPVANIPGIEDLNIGHSIISRAVFVGLEKAVKEMLSLIG